MIIVKLSHGLGNQLFQYALARHLSIINNTSFCFDIRYYENDDATETFRQFKLDQFGIPCPVLKNYLPLRCLFKSYRLAKGRTLKPFFHPVSERCNLFHAAVLQINSFIVYLEGFWQSERYFKGSAGFIRKDLSLSCLKHSITDYYRKQIAAAPNPVSIHIRRGDYVSNPRINQQYGFIGLDYYCHAISVMKERIGVCSFFVFSDDPEWVAQHLDVGTGYVLVNNNNGDGDLADLHLMSLCRHHIIANSSFSWWGAWLNSFAGKVVISPKEWYKNKPDFSMDDLLPESWMRV